jgi:hypothetical protein
MNFDSAGKNARRRQTGMSVLPDRQECLSYPTDRNVCSTGNSPAYSATHPSARNLGFFYRTFLKTSDNGMWNTGMEAMGIVRHS